MDNILPLKRLVVLRRFAELLIPTILLSALISALNVLGFVVQRERVVFMTLIFVIVFHIYNFINLKNCYFDLRNPKLFILLNLATHIIYATLNLLVFLLAANKIFVWDRIYAWMFSITMTLKYLDIDTIYSILAFHIIGLLAVLITPIGMGWIFEEAQYIDEDIIEE